MNNTPLPRRLYEALQGARPWEELARPAQLPPPGDWRIWLLLGGRGSGKTRAAGEFIRSRVEAGRVQRIAIVARTSADLRDVIVEGPAGLLAIASSFSRPLYEPSKRRLTWPNGATALLISGEEPDLLRGPQFDLAWCDELAAWDRGEETWDNLMLGLRLGADPRVVITTTPRPIPLIRGLVSRDGEDVRLTRMSTYENLPNLAPAFAEQIVSRYANTWIGRQELNAEILEDRPGALWSRQLLDETRVERAPDLVRIVVGVDPAVTATSKSDSTGIVVAGLGVDEHFYVLEDASVQATPDQWARVAIAAYMRHRADRIIAEVNNGGDLVELVLRTVNSTVPFEAVHASRGKIARAEPVSALFEQRRAHIVSRLPELEDELCNYVPGMASPDRLDAMVWALTALLESGGPTFSRAHMESLIDPNILPLRPEEEVEGYRHPEEIAAELEAAFNPTEDDEKLPKVTVEFLFQFDQWDLHDRVDVTPAEAAVLVKAGVATYATGPALSRLARRRREET
jgi:predicted phage terminase large subunit-like protein